MVALPENPVVGDLRESKQRMEAKGHQFAVWPDGRSQVTNHPADIRNAWTAGATVWGPSEMLDYVGLPPDGRRLMRELKGIRIPTVEAEAK